MDNVRIHQTGVVFTFPAPRGPTCTTGRADRMQRQKNETIKRYYSCSSMNIVKTYYKLKTVKSTAKIERPSETWANMQRLSGIPK